MKNFKDLLTAEKRQEVSAKRAQEILDNPTKGGGLDLDSHERNFFNKVWDGMKGSKSFADAVQLVANGMNEEALEEKTDLSKYEVQMANLTADNNHRAARLLMAKLCGDKDLLKVMEAIAVIQEFEQFDPISEYTSKTYTAINKAGRKKHGKEEWDKYIYSNS